jgi:hypothetical protein
MNTHRMLNEKPRPEVSGGGRLCFVDDCVPLSPLAGASRLGSPNDSAMWSPTSVWVRCPEAPR